MKKSKRQDFDELENIDGRQLKDENLLEVINRGIKQAQEGLNGVLFAMSKKGSRSRVSFLFFMFVDFLQMLSFVLPPPEIMDFSYPSSVRALARAIVHMQIGYQATKLFTVVPVLFVCLIVVVLELLNLFYVGYMWTSKNFKYLWTIQVLRHTMSSCVGILFIPFVGVMANVLTCRGIDSEETCTALQPITLLALVVFISISLLVSVTLFDPRPMSLAPSARPHARITTLHLMAKTVFTLVFSIVQTPSPSVGLKTGWAFLVMSFSGVLAYLFCWYQPYFDQDVGVVRAVLSGILAWTASCTFLHVRLFYGDNAADLGTSECAEHDTRFELTSATTLYGGLILVVPLMHAIVQYRRQSLVNKGPKECVNVFELELKCRLEIQGVGKNRHFKVLSKADPNELHDRAMRVHKWYIDAASVFPSSSALCVFHAHVLLDFLCDRTPLVRRAILIAERRGLDIDLHFAIYKTKRLLEENLTASSDLLGYVKSAMYMKEAVALDEQCTAELVKFWDELHQANPDVYKVRNLALNVARLSSGARESYLKLLHLSPKNPEFLEKFGSFLIEVCSDYQNGLAVLNRAARLTRGKAAKDAEENLDDINSDSIGIIVMSAVDRHGQDGTGAIISTNPMACQLLNTPSQTMLGSHFQEFCFNPVKNGLDGIVQRFIEFGDDSWFDRKIHTFLRTPTGEVLEVNMKLKPFASDGLHFEIYALFTPVRRPKSDIGSTGDEIHTLHENIASSFILVDPKTMIVLGLAGQVHSWLSGHPASSLLYWRSPVGVSGDRGCNLKELVLNSSILEEAIIECRASVKSIEENRVPTLDDLSSQPSMIGKKKRLKRKFQNRNDHRLHADAVKIKLDAILDETSDGSVGCLVMVSDDLIAQNDLEDEDIERLLNSQVKVVVERVHCLGRDFVKVCVSNSQRLIEIQRQESSDYGYDEKLHAGMADQALNYQSNDTDSNLEALLRRAMDLQSRSLAASAVPTGGGKGDGASSVYSNRSDSVRAKAHKVRRELIKESKVDDDPSIERVRKFYIATSLFVAAVALYQYFHTTNVLDDFQTDLDFIHELGFRKFYLVTIAFCTRSLDLIRMNITNSTYEQNYRDMLSEAATELKDLDAQMFALRGDVGGTLQTLYEDENSIRYLELQNDELQETNYTLFDAILKLSSLAIKAVEYPLSDFSVSESTVFPLVANLNYVSNSPLWGLATTSEEYTEYARISMGKVEHQLTIEAIVLGALGFLLLVVSLYPLLGNDERVERTKLGVLKVFLQMPRNSARELTERYSSRMTEIHGGIQPIHSNDGVGDGRSDDGVGSDDGGSPSLAGIDESEENKGDAISFRKRSLFESSGRQKSVGIGGIAGMGESSRITRLPADTPVIKRAMTTHIERLRGELEIKRRRNPKRLLRIMRMCVLLVFTSSFSLGMIQLVSHMKTQFNSYPYDAFFGTYRQVKSRKLHYELRLRLTGAFSDMPRNSRLLPSTGEEVDFVMSLEEIIKTTEELQTAHEDMIYGNSAYGLKGIIGDTSTTNELLSFYTTNGCTSWPSDAERTKEECETFRNGVITTGFHSAIESYLDMCLDLESDESLYDESVWEDPTRIVALLEQSNIKETFEFEDDYLQVLLQVATDVQFAAQIAKIAWYKRIVLILCLVFFVFDLLSYLFVVGPSIRALKIEMSRARQLILFVPEDVIPDLPHVQRFLIEDLPKLSKHPKIKLRQVSPSS